MIVHIPDGLYEKCGSSEDKINNIVKQFYKYEGEDPLILNRAQKKKLQLMFDAVVVSGEDLVQKVEKLNSVSVAGAAYSFSNEQLLRIKEQADFYGKDSKVYIQEIVSTYMNQMLGEV